MTAVPPRPVDLPLCVLPLCVLLLAAAGCSDSPSDGGAANTPPQTYLALVPDSALATGESRQHMHWWGDDPDGFVAGFQVSFDGAAWTFTRSNDSVFTLTLSGSDTAYTLHVRAVDTQGNGRYDDGGPCGAEPYTDANGNGRHDEGEPFIDLGLPDPTPATLRLPIRNTPPVVAFVTGSDVPDTTFTVASFAWTGSDLDGDETIREYRYALNDSTPAAAWRTLARGQTFLTLHEADGLRPGDNVFYLKAVDIAGAESGIIRMPREGDVWFVRRPATDLLVVDDYSVVDESAQIYRSMLDTLLGGRFHGADVLDIRDGATSSRRGRFVPPYVNPTLIETLKLFRYVLWYCDNNPTIDVAQLSLAAYQQSGGRIIYTASFPESAVDPRGGITDYAPVDSIAPQPIQFVPARTRMEADAESPGWPTLERDTRGVPVAFIRELFRTINAANLYRFSEDARWAGRPVVAVRSGDRRFVLFGVPLHRFDGAGTAGAVLRKIFTDEFGVR
jgi:hypothetical protein